MLRTDNIQINVGTYWDGVYSDPERQKEYWGKSERFIKALEYLKPKDKFLDIGCGVGTMCKMVEDKYPDVEIWGADISKKTMERNKTLYPKMKFFANRVGSLRDIPDNYFDVVFAGEILEHLDDPDQLFKDAYSKLKKGGIFIVTTPYKDAVHSQEHVWYFDNDDIENLYINNGYSEMHFEKLPNMEYLYVMFSWGVKV